MIPEYLPYFNQLQKIPFYRLLKNSALGLSKNIFKVGKYTPHQGAGEKARRCRQLQQGRINDGQIYR